MLLDLLAARGITPKKKAATHGGEYASPCPACGGKDRFLCWPEQGERGTWYCRGCDRGGDAIEFLRVFDGLSFAEACERLKVRRECSRKPLAMPKPRAERDCALKEHALPEEIWRRKAGELLACAHRHLLGNPAELARLAARGVPRETVERFRLGWLPGEKGVACYYRARSAWGLPQREAEAKAASAASAEGRSGPGARSRRSDLLWIPRGLVIPALGPGGVPLRLRIRRPDADRARFLPEMKYYAVPGSGMEPLLLPPRSSAGAWVVVESELDAMACAWAAELAGLPVGALAVGTNRGKPDAKAHAALAGSMAILVALDFDAPDKEGRRPGAAGFPWWSGRYRQALRWPVPQGKDPGEAFALGTDLAAWLRAGLPPALTQKAEEDKRYLSVSRLLSGRPDSSGVGELLLGCLKKLGLREPESPREAMAMLGRLGVSPVAFEDCFVLEGTEQLADYERVALRVWSSEHKDMLKPALPAPLSREREQS
ncbi:MAG: DNA primase [Deltaproteobacteria bacterium]|jgi:hypothetical protein|nr:DNA primase [Deltaproteobacteria bacterium]